MAKGFFSKVIEKVAESSKDVIGRLLGMGLKKADIAKQLKIDSSTISQLEKGKKPGANLTADLLKIEREVSGAESPRQAIKAVDVEPPRRLAKSGEIARVRESAAVKEAREEIERIERREIDADGGAPARPRRDAPGA